VSSPQRNELAAHLARRGIETQLHYPVPVHLQDAYRAEGRIAGSLEVTERLASEVLSLPIYPGLDEAGVRYVCEAVRELTG
jgi:dTDP-4-amino-4,6-dideoxygalactose transaminase